MSTNYLTKTSLLKARKELVDGCKALRPKQDDLRRLASELKLQLERVESDYREVTDHIGEYCNAVNDIEKAYVHITGEKPTPITEPY